MEKTQSIQKRIHLVYKTIHSGLDRLHITKKIKSKTCKISPTSISDHDSVSVII